MTIKDYQDLALRTDDGESCDRLTTVISAYNYGVDESKSDPGDLINGALGLTGEAGEVADMIKKYIFHGHKLDKDALIKELGDVAWYLTLLAKALGVELEEVLSRNIDKLLARYPDGFNSEASINRIV